MSTRAGSTFSLRQVKQNLVKLLFHERYSKNKNTHHKLDASIYSYKQLRSAYLKKVQEIHPDKFAHQNKNNDSVSYVTSSIHSKKREFVQLQNAWTDYERIAKRMQLTNAKEAGNFTMFGVGCSFADSPQERDYRNEIMDQACRGWFSSGSLQSSSSDNHTRNKSSEVTSLCDDDLFVFVDTKNEKEDESDRNR